MAVLLKKWSLKMIVSARRMAHAIQLRDLALDLVQRKGIEEFLGPYPVRSANLGSIKVSYLPDVPDGTNTSLLDIWDGNKVFSIRWDKAGTTEVVNYKPGSWEAELAETV